MNENTININPSDGSVGTPFSLQISLKVPTDAKIATVEITELGCSIVKNFNLTVNQPINFVLNSEYRITYVGEKSDKTYDFSVISFKDN